MLYTFYPTSSTKTTAWSGGTTSELFIFPEESEFKSGDYKLRLSIATVEVEESTFTSLPDVNRTLMVLNGQLKLSHEGHHETVLNPLEKDKFLGDWNTKSWGKVTDFNLMTKGDCSGILNGYELSQKQTFSIKAKEQYTFIHNRKGSLKIGEINLSTGESVLIREANDIQIDIIEDSVIVIVEFS
jgi:environmental stress-induced protein Ves